MIELFITFIAAIISIILFLIQRKNNFSSDWCQFVGFFVPIVLFLLKFMSQFKTYLTLIFINICRKKIRVSMAYVYKICINDKYLLVFNEKTGKYQFVGGKYKYYEESKSELEKIGYLDDDLFPTNEKDDIAFYIPPFSFFKFLKWFNSEEGREIDHYREFYEELIFNKMDKSQLLDSKIFQKINLRKIKTVSTPIRLTFVKRTKRFEYQQFDCYEPIFDEKQKKALENLKAKGNSEYIKWVSAKDIEQLCYIENEQKYHENKIAEHTLWCYECKYIKK